MTTGVPQGSVLGPVLFILYIADVIELIKSHGLTPHGYADDHQAYAGCPPGEVDQLSARVSTCLDDVTDWMRANRLQLNTSKTEVIWFGTPRQAAQLPNTPLRIKDIGVTPTGTVRDLGVWLDSDLAMRSQISKTVAGSFAALRQLRSLSQSVSRLTLSSLCSSLVLSRLDFANSVLMGLPACEIARLQVVQNAAARLVYHAQSRDHVTPLLSELHWLRVEDRVKFKVATLTFKCLHGLAPPYLARDIVPVASLPGRQALRSASSSSVAQPPFRLITFGARTFASSAAHLWNSLPEALRSCPTLLSFRGQLKTHLFRAAYRPD